MDDEHILKKFLQERYAELATVKQTKESKSFAWLACYAVSKPAVLTQDKGYPLLHIKYSDMTEELQKNLPLVCHNQSLVYCVSIQMPPMQFKKK